MPSTPPFSYVDSKERQILSAQEKILNMAPDPSHTL